MTRNKLNNASASLTPTRWRQIVMIKKRSNLKKKYKPVSKTKVRLVHFRATGEMQAFSGAASCSTGMVVVFAGAHPARHGGEGRQATLWTSRGQFKFPIRLACMSFVPWKESRPPRGKQL